MAEAVIVSATRTAIGTMGGALAGLQATQLGAIAIREALRRAGVEGKQVDEVILGQRAGGGPRPEPRLAWPTSRRAFRRRCRATVSTRRAARA